MKSWKIASAIIALSLSTNVSAATVFNIQGIENLEWLELTETANYSRNQVEDLIGNGTLEGWRYATRSEVETLYDSLWGGTTESWSTDNYSGARAFFDAFGVSEVYSSLHNSGYRLDGYAEWNTYFGVDGDACVNLSNSCIGSVLLFDSAYGATDDRGWFQDQKGLSNGVDSANYQLSSGDDITQPYYASHLVRVSAVPVPASVWLFGSGLISLIALARKKKSYLNKQ